MRPKNPLKIWLIWLIWLIGPLIFLFPARAQEDNSNLNSIQSLKSDIEFLINQTPVEALLLFNVFGTNPDPSFNKHILSDSQINELCAGNCGDSGIGVNFATYYKGGDYQKARSHKMQWTLEIARGTTPPQNIASIINDEQVENVIIRIGVGSSSSGFDNPNDYANFLKQVASLTNKPFYAIAGPNEPDIENWAAPSCSIPSNDSSPAVKELFYDCVGAALAKYMNALIDSGLPNNVRLLSPAFNMTSFTFNDSTPKHAKNGIPLAMKKSGAKFDQLYAIAGNIYPLGDSMQNIWTNHVAEIISLLGNPRVVITESGPWSQIPSLGDIDLSLYDDYNVDFDQFYIHPIAGLYPNRDVSTIRSDLLNQGYEARCATPGFKIGMDIGGHEYLDDYINQVNEGFRGGEGTGFGSGAYYPDITDPNYPLPFRSTLTIDYRDVFTPVFRDVAGKKFLTSSLEEFFGFKDNVIKQNTLAEIRSAPINSLLTNTQRCEQSIKILMAQETMCNKLIRPKECPLLPRPIPQTRFTVFSLLEHVYYLASHPHESIVNQDLSDVHSPNTAKYICQALIRNDWDNEAKEALLNTPLTIDRAYRFAFLVTSIQTRMNPVSSGSMFSLYSHPNAGFRVGGPNQPKHLVLVNAFKVPDILTNNDTSGSARTPWNDPSQLTVQSLTNTVQKKKMAEEKSSYQASLFQAVNRYQTISQTKSSEIFCTVGEGAGGVGAGSCNDALSKSLVDIINGTADLSKNEDIRFDYFQPTCPELKKEPAKAVLDQGSLGTTDQIYNHENAGALFTPAFGGAILQKMFNIPDENVLKVDDNVDETHQETPLGKSNPAFAETWREGDPRIDAVWQNKVEDWGLKTVFYVTKDMENMQFPYNKCCDDLEVRFYLIYPIGYDLKTVQTVLAGSFMSSEQLINLANQEVEYDRIQLSNDQIKLEGSSFNKNFDNYLEKCPHDIYDKNGKKIGTEMRPPCPRSFGFNIVQRGSALSASLLGGQLGFWLREIQKTLNNKTSFAYEYLSSCKSTEQFLTGQCGQPIDPVSAPEPESADCTGLSCIAQPTENPSPTAPPTTPPEGPTCEDPTKDSLEVRVVVNENREWKIGMRCPDCTGPWGDLSIDAVLPDGSSYHWGPTNLGYPNGYLEFPCGGNNPCAGHGSKVPNGFKGDYCINLSISGNNSGNQCGGTAKIVRCATVP